ncbi:MAG: ABC transporter substrate-binding protein [Tissierellaceae bacterium]
MQSRNLKSRIILLGLAVIMLLSAMACSKTEDTPHKDEKITIKDQLGREVTLDKEAERIVSGYYISTSMLIALGLKDRVVGVEANANTRPIYAMAAAEFLDLPNVGTAKDFNLEGTLALEPDLVIVPVRLKDTISTLEDMGIKVIAIDPEDMDLLKESLQIIGKATGTEDRAKKLISYYDEKTQKIKEIAKNNEESKKRIYFGGNSDFLSTATKRMYQNYMIETAGGENVADIDDNYWAIISYEQLISYNPDMIVIAPGAKYSKEDILEDYKLSGIDAIKNKQVYAMPSNIELWDSPIPSSILGTMWLNSILHEDEYSYEEFLDDLVEFYQEFYEISIEKEKISK